MHFSFAACEKAMGKAKWLLPMQSNALPAQMNVGIALSRTVSKIDIRLTFIANMQLVKVWAWNGAQNHTDDGFSISTQTTYNGHNF